MVIAHTMLRLLQIARATLMVFLLIKEINFAQYLSLIHRSAFGELFFGIRRWRALEQLGLFGCLAYRFRFSRHIDLF
jgi:hypothetical protein